MPAETRRGAAAGFSLVEIMVSLGLAGLLAAAILTAAQIQAGLHRDQAGLQATLDNGRAALNAIAHDARLLGAPAWGWGLTNSTGAGPQTLPLYRVVDSAGADAPDRLDLIIPAGDALLLAAGVNPGATQLDLRRLDPQALADPAQGPPPNRDFAPLGLALLSNVTLRVPPGPPPLMAPPSPGCDAQSGGLGAALLRVSGRSGQSGLAIAPLTTGGCSYGRGSLVTRAAALSYFVDRARALLLVADEALLAPASAGDPPGSPVAEGIVDLQVAVGVDGLNGARDGTLSEDEWAYRGGVAGAAVAPWQPPSALRITIVARTLSPGATVGPGRPAVENRPGGPPDRFRYRVLSTTVVPRNLNVGPQ